MHFPAKQPCTNDTVCNAASSAHSIICTRLFREKMHSDWFNGIEILQGRWHLAEKVGYCYHSGLEKGLFKFDICPAGHETVNSYLEVVFSLNLRLHLGWIIEIVYYHTLSYRVLSCFFARFGEGCVLL